MFCLWKSADLVLTGEGRIDYQTAFGKMVVGVATKAKSFGIPVIAIAGEIGNGYEKVYQCGIDAIISITPRCMSLDEAMENAGRLIQEATERALRLVFLIEKGK